MASVRGSVEITLAALYILDCMGTPLHWSQAVEQDVGVRAALARRGDGLTQASHQLSRSAEPGVEPAGLSRPPRGLRGQVNCGSPDEAVSPEALSSPVLSPANRSCLTTLTMTARGARNMAHRGPYFPRRGRFVGREAEHHQVKRCHIRSRRPGVGGSPKGDRVLSAHERAEERCIGTAPPLCLDEGRPAVYFLMVIFPAVRAWALAA